MGLLTDIEEIIAEQNTGQKEPRVRLMLPINDLISKLSFPLGPYEPLGT